MEPSCARFGSFCLLIFIFCLERGTAFEQPRDTEFTFILPAGRVECFYQKALKNSTIEVEYQVIAGAGMDVDFTIAHPEGFRLVSDFRKSDGIHTIETMADGDYEICFDNSFSRMSEKMVFFEVITEGLLQDTAVEDWAQVVQPEELVDFKLDDIRDSMDGVRRRLERSMQMQTMLRAFEARDRNLQEDNLFRVTFWSSLNMLVMMVVALVQVYLLRSLFNDKRKVRT
ncbi:transmembrane emp24 domain-containing protein 1a isoform X1 [Huso huso]|uniref:Transmembrane emp24 domain-containing protein 1a isoform X1 n=1 Tax=Huso huso TaxID=61971 RepID=A0ABR0Y906_HUSHU